MLSVYKYAPDNTHQDMGRAEGKIEVLYLP